MNAESAGSHGFDMRYYSAERFVHYFQQIERVLRHSPRKMLEVGPGDQTVTSFLRGKGIVVETIDIDASRNPTIVGDIRSTLLDGAEYDLVLISEVLEHMPFSQLEGVLGALERMLRDGGFVIVSVPYSTLRLFPRRSLYGRLISCEGRLRTSVPMHLVLRVLYPLRVAHRLLVKGMGWTASIHPRDTPEYPATRADVHHWDAGFRPTTRSAIRVKLACVFDILEETAHTDTNCVFWILRKRGRSNPTAA